MIGRFQSFASETVVVIGETGEKVHNDLPMPAIAMGIGAFLALVAMLWVTTRFNPER